jgi:hypothetical protein
MKDKQPFYHRIAVDIFNVLQRSASKGMHVDIYIKNIIYSAITSSGKHYLGQMNTLIMNEFNVLKDQFQDNNNNSNMKVHFLDIHKLSIPRKTEIPFNGDGLHWTCISRKWNTRCEHQMVGKRRPDEVVWAAMQLILLDYCGLYQLANPISVT